MKSLLIPRICGASRVSTRNLTTKSNVLSQDGKVKLELFKNGSPSRGEVIGPYGLTRVDYSSPPPKWPMPPHPPPSPNTARRYFPHAVAFGCASLFVWIYLNQDPEVYDYWRQVEQGKVPVLMSEIEDEDGDYDDDADVDDEWENHGNANSR